MTGIYKIQSKIKPERIYVGSAINILHRWHVHLSDLKLNKHSSIKLQRHFNKYGKEDLIFIILELCFPEFLIAREQYYMNKLNSYFNICKIAGSQLGFKHSEESKGKMRDAFTEERIKNLNKSRIGMKRKPYTKEHKRAIGLSNLGKRYKQKNKSNCHCKKIINTKTGQIFNSITDAANNIGISRNALYLLFNRKKNTKYFFQYYEGCKFL